MLGRVREAGEVRSAEFARTDGRAGGWWEWKPETRALEHLFAAGEIMISRRDPNGRVSLEWAGFRRRSGRVILVRVTGVGEESV